MPEALFLQRAAAAFGRSGWGIPFAAPSRNLLLTPSGARFLGDGPHGGDAGGTNLTDGGVADVAAALAACSRLLAGAGGRRVGIVLSDLWMRYALVPVEAPQDLGDAELMALARGQFQRQHPDAAAWPLRVALQDHALLVAAVRPDMLEGLAALAARAGARVTSIEPLFAYLWRSGPKLRNDDIWFVVEEPGLLMAAFVRAGCLATLHSARLDGDVAAVATNLLQRQAALLGGGGGAVRLFSASSAPLALPPPWSIRERVRY